MMTDRPRVGVLFAPRGAAGLRDVVRACDSLGVEPILLVPSSVASADPRISRLARLLFDEVVVYPSPEGVPALELGLCGAVTFNDMLVEDMLTVQGLLGEASFPPRTPDKLWQRQRLNKAGLSSIQAMAVNTPRELSAVMASALGTKVLKPRRGVGGVGVRFLAAETVAEWAYTGRPDRFAGCLVEDAIPDGEHPCSDWRADFCSVEVLSSRSRHVPVAVFDKLPIAAIPPKRGSSRDPRFRTTGDIYPSALKGPVLESVIELAVRSIDALAITSGMSHVEIKFAPYGPEVIEVNLRMGGHLDRLTAAAGGPDLTACALAVAVGRSVDALRRGLPCSALGVFVPFAEGIGRVTKAVDPSSLLRHPGVLSVDEVARGGREKHETDGIAANVVVTADDDAEVRSHLHGLLVECGKQWGSDVQASRWYEDLLAATVPAS